MALRLEEEVIDKQLGISRWVFRGDNFDDTYSVKDQLKAGGCRWDGKVWATDHERVARELFDKVKAQSAAASSLLPEGMTLLAHWSVTDEMAVYAKVIIAGRYYLLLDTPANGLVHVATMDGLKVYETSAKMIRQVKRYGHGITFAYIRDSRDHLKSDRDVQRALQLQEEPPAKPAQPIALPSEDPFDGLKEILKP